MPHPRQQAVIDYLHAHGPSAPAEVGRAVLSDTKSPNRAGQTMLARMQREGLVVGSGQMMDRRYALTEEGRKLALPPEPAPRLAPPPGTPPAVREVERNASALLDEAGIPRQENGRILTLDARLQRFIAERDAADTSVPAELVEAAEAAVYRNPAVRAAMRAAYGGRMPSHADLMRIVVEAGVAALTESPTDTPTRH